MNFLTSFRTWIRSVLLILALALTDRQATALTNIIYLGDSYLDDGNVKALTTTKAPTFFPTPHLGVPW